MTIKTIDIPKRTTRTLLPENFKVSTWEELQPYFEELKTRNISSVNDLEKWMKDCSELEAVVEESVAWKYIKRTCDTANETYNKDFQFFVTEIQPKITPYYNNFNKKLIDSPFLKELDEEKYSIYIRGIKKALAIYREENIPLQIQAQTESKKYDEIIGAMTVEVDGKELTLQQATQYLKDTDRTKREEVFKKIAHRKEQDAEILQTLFNTLTSLRNQIAKNAGYKNYRDYMFDFLGRFDYTVKDCFDFHQSVTKEILPVIENFDRDNQQQMGLDSYKPWDTEVDPSGKAPLKPFKTGEELINKTIECFYAIRPYYGECLEIMKEMGHLDLESRKGKAPGGYNYPLYEIGVPFIFMNAVGSLVDIKVMVHEGGHAVHSFLSKDLTLTGFKNLPSEVAELASMSMELISMEYWHHFFDNEADLKRAKESQMKRSLSALLWIAAVDKFQHWIYENPEHTVEERTAAWNKTYGEFESKVIDWTGYEEIKANRWLSQLHIFEIPFYYIEYGFAQLGAIAMWRNFKKNPEQTLDNYEKALALGYTKSIPEIYHAAGIQFNFSQGYVKELLTFVKGELSKL